MFNKQQIDNKKAYPATGQLKKRGIEREMGKSLETFGKPICSKHVQYESKCWQDIP